VSFEGILETTTQQTSPSFVNRQLAEFLHELNIARRSLTLYPTEHPQVAACSEKTLSKLDKLFFNRQEITLGVAPDALFFEHQWLDKSNRSFTAFAVFLSSLGIASLSFRQGLGADELIRFCQLLRSDQKTIDEFGGFPLLLQQQQINKIIVVPIDYSAFRSSKDKKNLSAQATSVLWEDFLHGLLDDILDLGDGGLRLDPKTIAELLNEKISADLEADLPAGAVEDFLGQLLDSPQPVSRVNSGSQLGQLLNNLSPRLQESFLAGTFSVLDKNPEAAEEVLENLSPELLQNSLDPRLQQQLNESPRLVELVGQLAANPSDKVHTTSADSGAMSKEMVRARLDVLFSEEKHDVYLPDNYSSALQNIFSEDTESTIPEEERDELKDFFEQQSVEEQCCAVIFELLDNPAPLEDEDNIQQNLLDLSRFFLDTGNFIALRNIYQEWSRYIHSGKAGIDILTERLLASHTQQTFMLEVLDGIEIWGEEQAEAIRAYIATVGEVYTEPLIERLARAQQFSQRRYWMGVLEAIGADANQLLVKALDDDRWYLIRNLLIVLGKNIAPGSLKAINQLASHPHPKVRQEVMRVLFYCNPATANRMLSKELASPDPEARLAAIEVANLSQDPAILSYLHKLLQTELDSDLELEFKQQALTTLAAIGNRDSLSLLRLLLQRKGLLLTKRQKQFQLDIISSFAGYPRQDAEKILREIARGRQKQHAALATELLQQLAGESS
jgi:hypothetical protein